MTDTWNWKTNTNNEAVDDGRRRKVPQVEAKGTRKRQVEEKPNCRNAEKRGEEEEEEQKKNKNKKSLAFLSFQSISCYWPDKGCELVISVCFSCY